MNQSRFNPRSGSDLGEINPQRGSNNIHFKKLLTKKWFYESFTEATVLSIHGCKKKQYDPNNITLMASNINYLFEKSGHYHNHEGGVTLLFRIGSEYGFFSVSKEGSCSTCSGTTPRGVLAIEKSIEYIVRHIDSKSDERLGNIVQTFQLESLNKLIDREAN